MHMYIRTQRWQTTGPVLYVANGRNPCFSENRLDTTLQLQKNYYNNHQPAL